MTEGLISVHLVTSGSRVYPDIQKGTRVFWEKNLETTRGELQSSWMIS